MMELVERGSPHGARDRPRVLAGAGAYGITCGAGKSGARVGKPVAAS